MSKNEWTTEQKQCVSSRGGSLLVSAAAGAGKTTVLVERIVQRVLGIGDETPVDVDRLLVVTFTRAAAAEMKQRLSVALTEAVSAHPEQARLRRQLLLLPSANISTIDSFCGALLREHAAECDNLSPVFKTIDEIDATLLREAAMTEVLERYYGELSDDFLFLAESFNTGKDDAGLKQVLRKLHDFLASLAFPDEWVERELNRWNAQTPFLQTEYGQQMKRDMETAVAEWRAETAKLGDHPEMAKTADISQKDEQNLQGLLTLLQNPAASPDDIAAVLLPKWNDFTDNTGKKVCPALFETVKEKRERIKALVNQWKPVLPLWDINCRDIPRLLRTMYEVEQAVEVAYRQKKDAAHSLDFSDVERLALHLLITRENGVSAPTPLAMAIREQLEEIFIDEYQDVNELQEALFWALSREEQNCFFVGDVKQSIYGFRRARPQLFLKRLNGYGSYDEETYPAVIHLKENFRSRPGVTNAVNYLCAKLFSEEAGGLVYGEREALVPHREAANPSDNPVLLVVDAAATVGESMTETTAANEDDLSDLSTDEAEATVIAHHIRALMDSGFSVAQKDKTTRPLRYSDCCILFRSFNAHADTYQKKLNQYGVPACAVGVGDFFAASEVSLMLALLRCIDNPRRDVPLLAVLMSPLFGFTPDDVATIRISRRRERLCVAVRRYARFDNPLGNRCAAFLQTMETYRLLAATVPVDKLIRQLFEDTDLLYLMAARPNGEKRVANLRLLHEWAQAFENGGFRGLSPFLRRMDRIKQGRGDNTLKSIPTAVGGQADTVQMMSIHHSKGLEFPVVFVAGMNTKWNLDSIKGGLLLHEQAGVGMTTVDIGTTAQRSSLSLPYVKDAIRLDERAEILRLLYVAMTRAREKLFLVTTLKNPQKKLTDLAKLTKGEPLSAAFVMKQAKSMSDWVLAALLPHPDAKVLRDFAGVTEKMPLCDDSQAWDIQVVKPETVVSMEKQTVAVPQEDEALTRRFAERFAYEYPYLSLQHIPNKMAASDWAHREHAADFVATAQPAMMNRSGLTGAQRGTATHLFMQYADWNAAADDEAAELSRLRDSGYLTAEQAEAVDTAWLRAFFQSDLYARITAGDRLWREIPFAVEWPIEELSDLCDIPPDERNETILMQGMADCVFEEQGELIIVDYKTDRVKNGEELADRYHRQLQLYAKALTEIMGKPVRECWLYSFTLGQAVPVEM